MFGDSLGDRARPHTHTQDNSSKTGPSSTSTALRDAVEVELRAAPSRTREAESRERQFVRWAYGDDCTLPHLPASQEAKLKHRDPSTIPPIDRVLGALGDFRAAKSVDEWEAHCPVHEDSKPSLVVRRNADGMVWIKCWSGCSKESILAALGLQWRDLWEATERDSGRRNTHYAKPLLPPHLRRAMEDLLRLDDERRAA